VRDLPALKRLTSVSEMVRKGFALFAFLVILVRVDLSPSLPAIGIDDPMEARIEKLRAFREKRDRFFKEDARSPLKESDRRGFKGLAYFPVDLRYAFPGSLEIFPRDAKPTYVSLPTNKGTARKYIREGRFKFRYGGVDYVLQAYRLLAEAEVFLPFEDMTSGAETHSNGRYLFVEPAPGGKVLVDFNRAYNPFCEYNEKYTCPLPLPENWLPFPVRAGEKKFRSALAAVLHIA
jgi:uncharacterized protein